MNNTTLVEKPVKLIVYSYADERVDKMAAMLSVLSGLNVEKRGGSFLARKFYAYFDDVASAQAAAQTLIQAGSCRTKVCTGTFDVTNLVKDTHPATSRDRKIQARVSKTSLAKEAKSVINAIKRSKTERYYKKYGKN